MGKTNVIKEGQILMKGRSLYLLSTNSSFRRKVYNVTNNKLFEYMILVVILLSSVQLALENPLLDPEGTTMTVLYYIDLVMTTIFVIEAAMKIISYGFFLNFEDSYLKSVWNIIDFVIVIFSVISLSLSNSSLKIFKVFRLLRILRPLKVIAKNEGLKVAIQALLLAIPNILNVTIITLLFFLIFGIIGVNYFKG